MNSGSKSEISIVTCLCWSSDGYYGMRITWVNSEDLCYFPSFSIIGMSSCMNSSKRSACSCVDPSFFQFLEFPHAIAHASSSSLWVVMSLIDDFPFRCLIQFAFCL